MNGIPRRQGQAHQDYGSGTIDDRKIDRENIVDDSKQRVERRLDLVAPVDRDVAMQNLLQNLCIRHQLFMLSDASLQELLGGRLPRRIRANEVHWDVGIDEYQACGSPR